MIGSRLAHYEITAHLGSGGMGDVYQATDLKLGRSVAVKFLPEAVASDAERVARFEREARVLASLNHPNIAAIHGLEEADGKKFLVMELVDGETLADRIRRPIPIDEALAIARQMCEALESAHGLGIIHRDLKPANIKVRDDGTVKVLDFGLAKAFDPGAGSREPGAELANSPTITSPAMTMHGVILGTAAYMSPEQARGKAVDRRTDIWAFGVVLYEMIAGARLFEGNEISDVLAAVLRADPDWTRLPAATPPQVRTLLRRCLQKDARKRLADAADARLELDDALQPQELSVVSTAANRGSRAAWSMAALLGVAFVAAGAIAWQAARRTPAPATPIRFTIPMPDGVQLSGGVPAISVSPDGLHIAFVASSQVGRGAPTIWVRSLADATARMLVGTDGSASPPMWSPDSRFLAFFSGDKLKKVPLGGGPPVTVTSVAGNIFAIASWSKDDVMLYAADDGLHRVSAAGGAPTPASSLDRDRGDIAHVFPTFLPDGRQFLFVAQAAAGEGSRPPELRMGTLDTMETSVVMEIASQVVYSADHLLFWRDGGLIAQPFDAAAGRVTGAAVPVAEGVGRNNLSMGFSAFAASPAGVLAYAVGASGSLTQLTWYDRSGKPAGVVGEPAVIRAFALSPDGQRVAVSLVRTSSVGRSQDIWVIDPGRSINSRLTFDDGNRNNGNPVWSPDGGRIFFAHAVPGTSSFADTVQQKAAEGTGHAEVLLKDATRPASASRDGRYLAGTKLRPNASADVWVTPLFGERKPFPVMQTPFREHQPAFSPDTRWLAYTSNESGQDQVYVEPFPATGRKFQVSAGGGNSPQWRQDGKELFFLGPDGALMAAVVTTGVGFESAAPQLLFPSVSGVDMFDRAAFAVNADGSRFLFNVPQKGGAQGAINVIVNWPAILQQ